MPLHRIIEQPIIGFAWLLAIVVAISVHEFAHAAVATALGDETARSNGRLTLNPAAHIDPFGFLLLLLVGFGWGRPVPFDPRALRAGRWGPSVVALAGPFANVVSLIAIGVAIAVIDRQELLPANNLLLVFLVFSFHIHAVLLLFNCIPIPPLDGSKVLLGLLDGPRWAAVRYGLETHGPILLLGLVVVDSLTGGALLGVPFSAFLHWIGGLF